MRISGVCFENMISKLHMMHLIVISIIIGFGLIYTNER